MAYQPSEHSTCRQKATLKQPAHCPRELSVLVWRERCHLLDDSKAVIDARTQSQEHVTYLYRRRQLLCRRRIFVYFRASSEQERAVIDAWLVQIYCCSGLRENSDLTG